jgi:predicted DNA binding protein
VRRLILESSINELARFLGEEDSAIERVELFEVLDFLREEPEEIAMICRAKLTDSSASLQDVFSDESAEVRKLQDEGNGSAIYFMKRHPNASPTGLLASGGYLSGLEVRDGRIRANLLGSAKEIKRFLTSLSKIGVKYKVVSLADARFAPKSPLQHLTEKQRRALVTAFNLGYFELPKRISSEELGKVLKMKSSTFVTHRIRAEKRLLEAILNSD